MQNNTITLAVDLQNTGTTTDEVYTRHDEGVNRSVYTGAAHSFTVRDTMTLSRVYPKRTGAFFGVAKSAVKFTSDKAVAQADGTETKAPLIGEISFAIPVGASANDVKALRQRMIAVLDSDGVMDGLNVQLSI